MARSTNASFAFGADWPALIERQLAAPDASRKVERIVASGAGRRRVVDERKRTADSPGEFA